MVGRAGFTLIEAIIAVTIGAFLVIMVSGVFLVQNDFYDFLLRRSQVQDGARTVVHGVQSVLPSVSAGGVVVALPRRLVVRRPQVVASVCAIPSGAITHVFIGGGIAALTESDGKGVANWIPGSGWDYHTTSVASLTGPIGSVPASACVANGADTLGVTGDFMQLNSVGSVTGATAAIGDPLMIYEDFELSFSTSVLYPTQDALFAGISGGTLVEYANGLDSDAGFEYRVGGSWATSVSGGGLVNIEAIRVKANTRSEGSAAAGSTATFDLVVDIPVGGL